MFGLALILFAWPLSSVSAETLQDDCRAWLIENPDAWRALPPDTLDHVRRRVRNGEPELHLWQGSLVCDHIDATLCTESQGRGECLRVRLSDPERGCAERDEGPFCVTMVEGAREHPTRAALVARLASWSSEDAWRGVERDGVPGASLAGASGQDIKAELWPLMLALVTLVLLLLCGMLWGRLTLVPFALRVSAWPCVALALVWTQPQLSTWDLLTAGGLLAWVTWLSGRQGFSARSFALRLSLSVLLFVVCGEALVRVVLPAPAPTPPPQHARLLFEPEARERACQALYPSDFPDVLPAAKPELPRVLHVGDSMVEGREVLTQLRFTELLNGMDEAHHHLNAGFSGTGPDHHYRLIKVWLERFKPSAVVLYLYPGNDLLDMDRDYACADAGPLLDGALNIRSETPQWSFPLRALLARSPPPYLLRVASSFSDLAAHSSAAFSRLVELLEPRLGDAAGSLEAKEAWARYDLVIRAIHTFAEQQGVQLRIVLLPTRAALEPGGEENHAFKVGERMAEVLRIAKIGSLDARQMFRTLGRSGSFAHLFSDQGAHNEHFGTEGHQALANWLSTRLRLAPRAD